MNKPSERIVVFVTPAQKRAISASADELGISISELMRRAVLAFSATSDQVKAASIVDRLNATREPDALALVLRKAARPLRGGRGAGLRPAMAVPAATGTEAGAHADVGADEASAVTPEHAGDGNPGTSGKSAEAQGGSAERELAQAVARLSVQAAEATAAEARAALPEGASAEVAEPLQPLGGPTFARAAREDDEETHPGGPTAEGGKFA
jgi:hypothetical protein